MLDKRKSQKIEICKLLFFINLDFLWLADVPFCPFQQGLCHRQKKAKVRRLLFTHMKV